MKYTSEITKQIIAALTQRGAPHNCPLCEKKAGWTIVWGFFFMPAQGVVPGEQFIGADLQLTGKGMPLVALTCNNCGNTHLVNLAQIGLAHLFTGGQ